MKTVAITAALVICPRCASAAIVIDGKIQGPVTLFMKDGLPAMTPHIDECPYRGMETPKE